MHDYVAYNPWPECIMCGRLENVLFDDPVIYREIGDAVLPQDASRASSSTQQGGIIIIGG